MKQNDNEYVIYAENENDFESKFEEYKLMVNSYMTKEEFITIINNLDFKCIKSCDLELITSFIVNCKDKSFKQLYKKVSIE